MHYVDIQYITKKYGTFTALNEVCLQVAKGCVYGLLGPNGAGKSSLIRIINRITVPDNGQVLLNGQPYTDADISKIGYLPEERGLYKKMKVGEHIVFLARLKGMTKTEAQRQMTAWLAKFDIASWENKKVEELSKGMQQKVQFIATVIHNPDLLILDEPFSGFDPVNSELLRNEILELKAKGKTIILSTHNMESVEALCDEITLINKSKVMLQGEVKGIRQRFKKHIFRFKIEGVTFDMESANFDIISQLEDRGITEVRIQLKNSVSNSAIVREIASKYELIAFEEELPTMNDIFIQIVSTPAL